MYRESYLGNNLLILFRSDLIGATMLSSFLVGTSFEGTHLCGSRYLQLTRHIRCISSTASQVLLKQHDKLSCR